MCHAETEGKETRTQLVLFPTRARLYGSNRRRSCSFRLADQHLPGTMTRRRERNDKVGEQPYDPRLDASGCRDLSRLPSLVRKADQALMAGVHLLIVDLFAPGPRNPSGILRAIWGEGRERDFALPDDKPLTCVSYVGSPCIEVFLEPVAVGDSLPEMPLFLTPELYVPLPLDATYRASWDAFPAVRQSVLAAAAAPVAASRKTGRLRR